MISLVINSVKPTVYMCKTKSSYYDIIFIWAEIKICTCHQTSTCSNSRLNKVDFSLKFNNHTCTLIKNGITKFTGGSICSTQNFGNIPVGGIDDEPGIGIPAEGG